MDEKIEITERRMKNILDCLSEVGGIFGILSLIGGIIASKI
jgi:hypothetical protein